jgi:catechol 2,3-dioxygenase-like lactoylglutathione lyase family enzyme
MGGRPKVNGVLETCLYVTDVAASRAFYERVCGFDALVADERILAFDAGPGSVLILFRRGGTPTPIPVGGGFIPPHDGSGHQHFALAIAEADYESWKAHLAVLGIAVESEVAWPQGGRSLYFRDPDGLVVELATPGLWRNY